MSVVRLVFCAALSVGACVSARTALSQTPSPDSVRPRVPVDTIDLLLPENARSSEPLGGFGGIFGGKRVPRRLAKPAAVINFPDGENWMLETDLLYEVGVKTGLMIKVPRGFVTDFASIPQALRSFLGTTGRYSYPAIVHDYLYWTQSCTREQADNIFGIAMKESSVGKIKAWEILRAVQTFGSSSWNKNRVERASGLVRTLSAPNDTVPTSLEWRSYRQALKRLNVHEGPQFVIGQNICALGNTAEVPK